MGIAYRADDDLAFLQYCDEEDLRQLAQFIIHDKDGNERIASQIKSDPSFKSLDGQPGQWQKSWKLIAGELQHFGGDSVVNLFRRKGVLYREMLSDVCGKFQVKHDKKSCAYDIENLLIERLVEMSWEKMSEAERQGTLKTIQVSSVVAPGSQILIQMIRSKGPGSLAWSSWLAQSASSVFAPLALSNISLAGAAGFVAQRGGGAVVGPLAIFALTIPMLTGTAYRVTVPVVIQIAYMRRKYEEEERF
jgi:uncharacterized protein YaaW (UPF0174 family)